MSVMLETSAGTFVVDVHADVAPLAATNFVKQCKRKYYNGCLFYNIERDFIIQTGDPTGTGKGGKDTAYRDGALFPEEISARQKLDKKGLVGAMRASDSSGNNGSQFFVLMRGEQLEYLKGKYTIFGEVAEGMDTLEAINKLDVDESGRPFCDCRILHTYVLDDPFQDPDGMPPPPPGSPVHFKPPEETVRERIGFDETIDPECDITNDLEAEKRLKAQEARSRAVVLEMVGDIPDADVKPEENVLFVCKLNAVTEDDDLEIIFGRFGEIKSCEVIRDKETGESLNYAFVEFATKEQCEEAYVKMNNVLIDDRRIKVDFCQSVAKLWNRWRKGPKANKREQPTKPRAQARLQTRTDRYQRDDREHGRNEQYRRGSRQHGRNDGYRRDGRRHGRRDDRYRRNGNQYGRDDPYRKNERWPQHSRSSRGRSPR